MSKCSYFCSHLKRSFKQSLLLKEVKDSLENEVVELIQKEKVILSQDKVVEGSSKISVKKSKKLYSYEIYRIEFTKVD